MSTQAADPKTQFEPKRFVRLFKPRFARLVETGAKLQTVRPTPKRMPRVGDILDAREWTGLPYRSPQRKLIESPFVKISPLMLRMTPQVYLLFVGGHVLHKEEAEAFARADGFTDFYEMANWFENEHGLPFSGTVFYWKPPHERA